MLRNERVGRLCRKKNDALLLRHINNDQLTLSSSSTMYRCLRFHSVSFLLSRSDFVLVRPLAYVDAYELFGAEAGVYRKSSPPPLSALSVLSSALDCEGSGSRCRPRGGIARYRVSEPSSTVVLGNEGPSVSRSAGRSRPSS